MSLKDRSAYRGRLAPSPTGLLHAGHAHTFWTACQRAHAAGGTLLLRDEDLDPQRSRPEYAAAMLEDLHWLGIAWHEGPDVGGPYAPYRQSERRAHYLAAWDTLRHAGAIYPCRCSRRELASSPSAPHEDGLAPRTAFAPVASAPVASAPVALAPVALAPVALAPVPLAPDEPLYPGTCRPAPGAVASAETPAGLNWRFRVPDGEAVAFTDGHYGPQQFVAGRDFGDFPVWRRDDVPAYQLAVVVDDAAMRITEVVRGADLLLSTARQILLYRALGLTPPAWYHCDLLRDSGGHRLAKRTDALSLRALRQRGVPPEDVLAGAMGAAAQG